MSVNVGFPVYFEVTVSENLYGREKQEVIKQKYEELEGVFKKAVDIVASQNTTISKVDQPIKLYFDPSRFTILCGYTKEKFRQIFPFFKKMANSTFFSSKIKGLPEAIFIMSDYYRAIRKPIQDKEREEFDRKFQEFHNEVELFYSQNVFPKRSLVDVSGCSTPEELISLFLSKHAGFGIGDDHHTYSTFVFLIQNMPLLKKLGVTTIFTESYPQHLEKKVRAYFNPSNPLEKFPKDLLAALKIQNESLKKYNSNFKKQFLSSDFEAILDQLYVTFYQSLKENGINLLCLEDQKLCRYASNEIIMDADDDEEESNHPYGAKWRMKPMNYYASQLLKQFIKDHPGEKLVYWMGMLHGSPYYYGDPANLKNAAGISDITGLPWVNILDKHDSQEMLVSGESAEGIEILSRRVQVLHKGPPLRPDAVLVMHPEK